MDSKPKLTEEQWYRQVQDLAQALGYRIAHFRPALTQHGWRTPVSGNGKGFPDTVIVSADRKRIIFAELKAGKGKCSPEQTEWLAEINGAGGEAYCWYPEQLEEVRAILMGA